MSIHLQLLLVATVLFQSPNSIVSGCGGFFCTPLEPVVQSAETIAFSVKATEDSKVAVTMQVKIQYEGPTERFSWILPLPALPRVSVGTDVLFARLMETTNPTFVLDIDSEINDLSACGIFACPEFALGATSATFRCEEDSAAVVLEAGSVGPFDYVIIEAAEGDNDSAYRWLNENGFDQPEGSGPLLNYYAVNEVPGATSVQEQPFW